MRVHSKIVVGVSAIVIAGLVAFLGLRPFASDGPFSAVSEGLSLSPPPVSAQTSSFLDQEAGIAGYAKVEWDATTNPTTWNNVTRQLQNVEKQGAEYIVGTYALMDYTTRWDPHVFISKDGWVVVYWANDESPGIFLDMKAGLEQALPQRVVASIAAASGANSPSVSYFDFAHPTANRIVLASIRTNAEGNSPFFVTVSSGIRVLRAGWAFWASADSESSLWMGGSFLTRGRGAPDAIRAVRAPIIETLEPTTFPIGSEVMFSVAEEHSRGTLMTLVLLVREG